MGGCTVSLKPSCEEISEPKHVRKGHCTNTLQLENSGTFAHVKNRFSILASDDDEKLMDAWMGCDVANQVTKIRSRTGEIGGERDDGFSCCYTRPLNSISRVCDQGNNVLFTKTGGWIINHETVRYTWFPREHGVYVLHSWVNESFPRQECWGSAIPTDTWSHRSV